MENAAVLDGGAISLTDPIEVYIIGATFCSNQALFGGAVSLASTIPTTGGVQSCRFETNDASNGGALYLSTGGTSDTGLPIFVEDSVFRHNIAGESPPTAAVDFEILRMIELKARTVHLSGHLSGTGQTKMAYV